LDLLFFKRVIYLSLSLSYHTHIHALTLAHFISPSPFSYYLPRRQVDLARRTLPRPEFEKLLLARSVKGRTATETARR
jgi:hypothetical protein